MRTRLIVPIVALGFIVAACSSSSPSPASTTPTTPAAGGTVAISLHDFSFNPATITASLSGSLVITNDDTVLHNVTIDGTPIDVDVQPGQTVTFTPPAPFPPGDYSIFCKYHKSRGMVGTLHATP